MEAIMLCCAFVLCLKKKAICEPFQSVYKKNGKRRRRRNKKKLANVGGGWSGIMLCL